jgi:hypothetical protein
VERLDKLVAAIDYRHALDGLVLFVNKPTSTPSSICLLPFPNVW